MFEVGWSELLVIGVVLIVVVGPKDLPRMLRTFGKATSQMRRMAGDFRRQFDEAIREAELDEVRDTVRDISRIDPRSHVRDALNPIRAVGDEIRSSLRTATKAPDPRPSVVGDDEMRPVTPEASATGTPEAPADVDKPIPVPQASPPEEAATRESAVADEARR
ncbi:Sec-independent protein translocase protein TatB [Aureimonas leprariae]|uniref:Sec-independent protein translocase protein TatB n=1 Tax=Plantimonas leprariae TaxID=2615207 RepID=A0A7V7TY47_9HYPH|nr:Sec-independent protein translocase protein TatB [Aureimonas leprariae]KAB0681985.1 twin-arginine translocase subunit TatB [Aureimonas leprariae]